MAMLAFALGMLVMGPSAAAQGRSRPHASSFSANKTFGLGIMLGAPTGLSGKYYLSAATAIDFGFGVIEGFGRDGIHAHADFLWHPAVLATTPPFVLPIYFGVGGRLFSFDRGNPNDNNDDDFALGVRVPGGIMMDFNNVPLDIFFELVFVLDFISSGNADADINGAIGVRYYFN